MLLKSVYSTNMFTNGLVAQKLSIGINRVWTSDPRWSLWIKQVTNVMTRPSMPLIHWSVVVAN